jgi:hypothetical protein
MKAGAEGIEMLAQHTIAFVLCGSCCMLFLFGGDSVIGIFECMYDLSRREVAIREIWG